MNSIQELIRPALCLAGSVLLLIIGVAALKPNHVESVGPEPVPSSSAANSPTPRAPRTELDPQSESASPPAPTTQTSPKPARERTPRPVRLRLPGGESMPVRPVGVADNGLMELPARPTEIGWYRFGPAPGASQGSAVLAGHVDSAEYGIGPLAQLDQIDVGDPIIVGTADGKIRFRVDQVRLERKHQLRTDGLFARTGRPRLVLITCGGPYDPERGYRDNLVVTARPAPR